MRRATATLTGARGWNIISIHALLAESDNGFIPRGQLPTTFLSTLSLRRATRHHHRRSNRPIYFYPRSPCGERPIAGRITSNGTKISIHALLAESDYITTITICTAWIFLSTLSLRRATRETVPRGGHIIFLSTLSLRRATMLIYTITAED